MDANPQRRGGRARRPVRWVRGLPARTPLRVKLVAALMVLVILALGGSGVVAAATLRDYLVSRTDQQLESVNVTTADSKLAQVIASGRSGDRGRGHGGDGDGVQLPSAFVLAVADAKGVLVYGPTSDLIDPRQPLPQLPHPTSAQTQAAGSHVITVAAVEGDSDWRVLVRPVQLADSSSGTLMVAQSLDEVDNTVQQLILLIAVIGVGGAVLLGAAGYLLIRASLRGLRDVERTAARIAAGDLSSRVPEADVRTEVGRLSSALNTMLGRVETAFAERAESEAAARNSEERMRRFVADASHELRTPLTSIRGFAELYRQRADASTRDVARMMQRIESESQRMGLLVEDLLLLARMDEERPLARLPVDLLALVNDAVHDARAVDPSRAITLAVHTGDLPPVVIGDEARLRQVLANVMTNALTHTPAGTDVDVRVATGQADAGWQATIEVRDHGPGLDPEQAHRVFERFYRADAARGRSTGGSGLGLAIVAALVAGHDGRVDVDTGAGRGATFTITLPLAAQS